MEINNFIIFIIIIVLSILLYKCAKIFNLRKMEKFSDRYSTSFNKGTRDFTGHIENTTGPLDVSSFADCEGDWSECTYDSTNNNCKKTYTISNPDFGGDSCTNESGTTKECIYDHCIEIDTYTYSDPSNPGSGSTEYHIMRGKTLIHYKRFDKGDPKQRQDNIEYDTGELWNSDKNGDDTNIQLLKLQQIMNEYNDDENYIGLIKHDVAGEEPKFYPIILDKDSEIEIVDESSHVLYMKKNINCRGRWESCKFDSETQQSTREYVVKYPGSGSSTISCPSSDGDIQICGEWGSCAIENIGNGESQNIKNIKKWEYRLPNNECTDIGKNCNHGENIVKTTQGCVQNNDCTVNWDRTSCAHSYDSDGNPQAIAQITSPATGNGKCAYISGSSYSIKKVFSESNNSYEDKEKENDDGTINYNNYICDEDYFPIGCKKKYDVYWGNGPWAGVVRDNGNIVKENGKSIPNNKENDPRLPGACWLHVYDYQEANNRYKLSNPSDKALCPMDDYEFNGFTNIDVGQRLDSKVSDIGKGPDRISLNRKDYGYQFKYNTISTNRCESDSDKLTPVPTSSNINDPSFLNSLGSNADDLISKLGSGTVGSEENKCHYQSLKNQYGWMVENLLDGVEQQNDSYKIELNRQLKKMNDTFDLYRGGNPTNENINENGWGEICKQKGIYPQPCQHEALQRNCTDLNQGFAGGKYKVINITSPAKYNGTCEYQQGQIIDTNNCIRIQLNNVPDILDVAGGALDAIGLGGMPGFSDIRLKKDINKIGISPMGIPIFTFRFKDDKQNTLYQGTIAQEIIDIMPEAVTIHDNGFYMVDYSKIDVEYKKLN